LKGGARKSILKSCATCSGAVLDAGIESDDMKYFTATDLKKLLSRGEYPAISIYLPTHVTAEDIRQDTIPLKNMLASCHEKLEPQWPHERIVKFLKGGYDLLNDAMFWQHQSEGLFVFISRRFSDFFNLPVSPPERLSIGRFAHVLPLIPAIAEAGAFYILVLSQKRLKLYQATHMDISEVELHDVPVSIDEVLRYDVTEEYIQAHTAPRGKSVGTDAVFHGAGDVPGDARRKKNIERYIRAVARGIDKELAGRRTPLVLAGVEYERVLYKQYSCYPHIVEDGFALNGGQLEVKHVHCKGRDIMKTHFDAENAKWLRAYRNTVSTGRTSEDIRQIVPAAFMGRVDTLLVNIEASVYGTSDVHSAQVAVHEEAAEGDEDLLNLAAIFSLRNEARVLSVAPQEIPGPAAAIFKY
jgi:hypothetical protein